MKITRFLAATSVALTAILAMILAATTVPAVAKDGEVVRAGACSGVARWKLEAAPEDRRIEVEAEVDSNRAGQLWRWTLTHDGVRVAAGSRQTRGRSGSFEVERVTANRAGIDTFVFRARRAGTRQVCRGVVRF